MLTASAKLLFLQHPPVQIRKCTALKQSNFSFLNGRKLFGKSISFLFSPPHRRTRLADFRKGKLCYH